MSKVTAIWTGTTADWNTPADWNDEVVPDNFNTDVKLSVSGAYTVSISSAEAFKAASVSVTDVEATLALSGTASLHQRRDARP
jgi:hypothetical protein